MFQSSPSRFRPSVRLFCIPHAGGGATAFRGWRERLAPEIEATIIRLPGREARFRDRPYERMEPLVEDLAAAVLPWLEHDQPFAFFGNSLGSLIAWETIQEIRRRTGREPVHVFVAAAGAPHRPRSLFPIGHFEDSAFIDAVNERYGGIPAPLLSDRDYLAIMLPALRADICLLENYRRSGPEPISCPITVFGGRFDATTSEEDLRSWQEQTRGAFELVLLDEDHLFLQSSRDPLTAHVSERLLACCAASQGSR